MLSNAEFGGDKRECCNEQILNLMELADLKRWGLIVGWKVSKPFEVIVIYLVYLPLEIDRKSVV